MRRLRREGGHQGFPCFGILRGDGRDAGGCGSGIGGDAQPCAIGKSGGKGVGSRDEFQAVQCQFFAISFEKGRACEQRQVHGGPVVAKAGQGICAGFYRAAGCFRGFIHRHMLAAGGQMQRAGQRVDPRADQDCIIGLRHFRPGS